MILMQGEQTGTASRRMKGRSPKDTPFIPHASDAKLLEAGIVQTG